MSEILTREQFGIALVLYRDAKPPTSNRNSRALFAHDAALRARVAELERVIEGLPHEPLCAALYYMDEQNCNCLKSKAKVSG